MKSKTLIFSILALVCCIVWSVSATDPMADDETYNVDCDYISDGSAPATELTPAILNEMQGWSVLAPGTVIRFPDPSGRSGKFYKISSDGVGFVELPTSSIRGYGDDCPFTVANRTQINYPAGLLKNRLLNSNGRTTSLKTFRNSVIAHV